MSRAAEAAYGYRGGIRQNSICPSIVIYAASEGPARLTRRDRHGDGAIVTNEVLAGPQTPVYALARLVMGSGSIQAYRSMATS